MPHGLLTNDMYSAIKPLVKDKVVWDLGAFDLGHSRILLDHMGAKRIVAVDKSLPVAANDCRIHMLQKYYSDVVVPEEGIEVAYLSWPSNCVLKGLLKLLRAAEVVIYLGSNTEGTACGWEELYKYLWSRELLAHVPYHRNSLIVVGSQQVARRPTPEEFAAMQSKMLDFDEAVRLVEQDEAAGFQTQPGPTAP